MRRLLMAFTIACLLSLALAGQEKKALNEDQNARSLEGIVTNAASNPVNGAIVQLKDLKTQAIRSYITHEDGKYHFAGLSTTSDYEVKASTSGGESSPTKRLSTFDTKKTAVIDLKLK